MALDEKRRFLIDKILMMHGSNLRAFSGMMHNLDEAETVWIRSLNCAITQITELFAQVFKEQPPETQPNEQHSTQETSTTPPATPILENGKFKLEKTITVKEVKVVRSGTRKNGQEWHLFAVKAMDNVTYTTFAGSRYQPGQTYPIEYEEVPSKDGSDVYYRIVEK